MSRQRIRYFFKRVHSSTRAERKVICIIEGAVRIGGHLMTGGKEMIDAFEKLSEAGNGVLAIPPYNEESTTKAVNLQ